MPAVDPLEDPAVHKPRSISSSPARAASARHTNRTCLCRYCEPKCSTLLLHLTARLPPRPTSTCKVSGPAQVAALSLSLSPSLPLSHIPTRKTPTLCKGSSRNHPAVYDDMSLGFVLRGAGANFHMIEMFVDVLRTARHFTEGEGQ